jgi:ferredoxin like protein
MKLEDKLYLDKFVWDEQSHIQIVSDDVCRRCPDKPCTIVCPADVYHWEEEGQRIVVSYENCIECGACRLICPYNNISCVMPRGGFGVQYRYG